jgi:peptidyl-prolyl cis-trans isomerase A (cyclophilin A)
MNLFIRLSGALLCLALLPTSLLLAAEPAESTVVAVPTESATTVPLLNPLPGLEAQVPALTEKTLIRLQTTAGDLMLEVYPQAAPNAVQRFITLVQSGFFDNTPVSRVVPGFVAQFGINWREPHKAWQDNPFKDDPSLFALERGTLAFAKAGPNTNSTQVFINYVENNRLAVRQYNFTTFGKVVNGMEIVDAFVEVGEPGMGLDQDQLWEDGADYLDSLEIKPTMIIHAEIVR